MPGIGLNPSGCCCAPASCAYCPTIPTLRTKNLKVVTYLLFLGSTSQTGTAVHIADCVFHISCVWSSGDFVLDLSGGTPVLTVTSVSGCANCKPGPCSFSCPTLVYDAVNSTCVDETSFILIFRNPNPIPSSGNCNMFVSPSTQAVNRVEFTIIP